MPRELLPHPTDPSILLVPLTRGLFAMVSVVDGDIAGQKNWRALKTKAGFYAQCSKPRGDAAGIELLLHRAIGARLGFDLDKWVDHRNGNGLDCRRENLRQADHAQNSWNRRRETATATGVKGVTKVTSGLGFEARIMVRGKRICVGTFATVGEAAAALQQIRANVHGQFARHA